MSRRPTFETIRSEGALLPTDLLQRIAERDMDLGGLRGEDYGLPPNEPLPEAIVRSYNRLLGAWGSFQEARSKLPEDDPGTSITRDRLLLVLLQELGYGRVQTATAIELEGRSYPVSHAWGKVPLHLLGCNVPLGTRSKGVAGASTQSPHGTLQELLNRSEERLWGIVSNGLELRLLRDNSSLTRQAFVSFDLEQLFEGDTYSDFAILYLLCHASRVEGERPHECWLERWSQEAQKQGTRALEGLRTGVEDAIQALGSGFLRPGANVELKAVLRSGELSDKDYYRELLRLVYRLLFLFVSEDRKLLHHPDASEEAKACYVTWYSSARLRRLAERRRGTKHGDLWESLRLVMRALGRDEGEPALGLPALGSFLWSHDAIAHLEGAALPNGALLEAVRSLATVRDGEVLRAVDYRNLGAEELGSVYESLLELHPELDLEAGSFRLTTAAGNERKTTGSYYTPSSLISCLLDTALDPVLEEASQKGEEAILELKVCDPACGSGHFLVAAAHRIGKRLASVRTGDEEPSPEATRAALRDVVSRCLYGVDLNPMAVELCKVSLWMEALDPGRPLSFLDAHIKCGNSLLGTTAALIAEGIPDDAFKALEGDDKEVAKAIRKQNKLEREGQLSLEDETIDLVSGLQARVEKLEGADDATPEELHTKERLFDELLRSDAYERAKLAADAWCAAYVQRKAENAPRITTGVVRRVASGNGAVALDVAEEVRRLASEYAFFHWEVENPGVFGRAEGGFDVVLGNPPWEQVEVASGGTEAEHQTIAAFQRFVSGSGGFPLTGRGRRNLYALFLELAMQRASSRGLVGMIVPTGVVTDQPCEKLARDLVLRERLSSLFDFENRGIFFPAVHRQQRFALISVTGNGRRSPSPRYGFMLDDVADTSREGKIWTLSADVIETMSPSRFAVPTFTNGRDATLAGSMYAGGVLLRQFCAQRDVGSGLFLNFDDRSRAIKRPVDDVRDSNGALRVFEGEYFHAFDHRFATFVNGRVRPTSIEEKTDPYSVATTATVLSRADAEARWRELGDIAEWYVALRRQASTTNETTAIAAVLPFSGAEGSVSCFFGKGLGVETTNFLCAVLSSFAFNFVVRLRQSGANLSKGVYEQIPIPDPERVLARWIDQPRYIDDRVLELSYCAHDLRPYAEAAGHSGAPFRWDPSRRELLRAELDAAFFHLYGLEPDDVDYVMDTFPIVRRRDEQAHDEYRTKRLILEIYDELAEAIATGRPYQTRLDPPPADPRVAHPAREEAVR